MRKLTIEFVQDSFEKYDYECLTKVYINSRQKLKYVCSKGHKHTMSWDNWKQGYRCPTCADQTKPTIEFVKERDGYKCLNPYCSSKNPDNLTVHHINYNKKSCDPENLITVCRSCNARANKDRTWHEAWYKAILTKRYGYNYGGSNG